MIRNKNRNITVPVQRPNEKGKVVWHYDDRHYKETLALFLHTQRPEGIFSENTRLRDPFRKFNNFKNKKYIHHDDDYREIDWVKNHHGKIVASLIFYDLKKMRSETKNVISFTQRKIKLDTKLDKYIYDFAWYDGYEKEMMKLIDHHTSTKPNSATIIECDMQLKSAKDMLSKLEFEHIDSKVSSFADVYGIWCKQTRFIPIQKIKLSQKCSLQQLNCIVPTPYKLLEQLKEVEDDMYSNHYSNYNKNDTWKGIVLRGYGGKEDFIIKPSEMTNRWKKENAEKLKWKCKNTPLRKKLSEVERYVDLLPFEEIERIRILKLSKGEGELERHTDIQDKEAGINDDQWARLHFPLITNDKVIFTQWNVDGTKTQAHMRVGELWYLDMRKPHTAVNFGEEDRYHLIIDVKSDFHLRNWLENSMSVYPPHKEVDDYED